MSSNLKYSGQGRAGLTVGTFALAKANAALADLHHGRSKRPAGAGALNDAAFRT